MPPTETLAYATLLLGLVAAAGAAANDAATGAASIVAGLTSNMRTALLIATVGVAFGMLTLASGQWAAALDQVLPLSALGDGRAMQVVLLSAVGGTAFATAGATWANAPAPVGVLLLASLATAASVAGAAASIPGIFGVVGAALAVIAVAAGFSFVALRVLSFAVLRYQRPRDRLRVVLPSLAGITLALGGASCLLGFDWAEGSGPPWWAGALTVAALAGLAATGAHLAMQRDPLRFTNDEAGAEAAFRRLQIGGSALMAALHGGRQTLLIGLPVSLALRLGQGEHPAGWGHLPAFGGPAYFVPFLCVAAASVMLGGQRVASMLGEQFVPTAAAGAVAINLGAQASGLLALALGLPVAGNQAALGGFIGLSAAIRTPGRQAIAPVTRILAAWLLAPLAAVVGSLAAYGICHALLG